MAGDSHREGEQTFDTTSEFLEPIGEDADGMATFVRASRFGEQQLRHAVKNGKGSAQVMGSVSHKLTQLQHGRINALQKVVKRLCQPPKLVMGGNYRQRCPESLPVRNTFSHQRSMLG